MLNALLRLDLRVDPRSRRSRRRSLVLDDGGRGRGAVCLFTGCWATGAERLRLAPRRRTGATLGVEARASRGRGIVAVEAGSRFTLFRHGADCADGWCGGAVEVSLKIISPCTSDCSSSSRPR
jgi:hypothetical protein